MKVFETGVKRKIANDLVPGTWYSFEYLKEATGYTRSILNARGRGRFLDHLSKFAEVKHDKSKRGRPVYFIGKKQIETTAPQPYRLQYTKCVRTVIEEWQSQHQTKATHKDISYTDLYSMYYGTDIRKYTPVPETYVRILSYAKSTDVYGRIRNLPTYTNVYQRIRTKDITSFNNLVMRAAFYQVSVDIYEIARTSSSVIKKHLLKNVKSNTTKTATKQQTKCIDDVFNKYGKGETFMLNAKKYKDAIAEIETVCPGYSYRGVLYDIKFNASFLHRELYTKDVVRKQLMERWQKIISQFISKENDTETREAYEALYELWKIYTVELQKQTTSM